MKLLNRKRAARAAAVLATVFAVLALVFGLIVPRLAEGDPKPPRTRPAWLTQELYPFEDRWIDVDGHVVHYIDEGPREGPVLLFMHGNPTWSFLYRNIIKELRDHYRCVAIDYPGFGLSTARTGYGFTPAEHSKVVEQIVVSLDLRDVTMMVQDWGGPIGLGLAGRQPDRFTSFVIGNTWAWPVDDDENMRRFSSIMGGAVGRFFIINYNFFAAVLVPVSAERALSDAEKNAYAAPFATRESRIPTAVFPKEIIGSTPYLREVEQNIQLRLATKPALILWALKDGAFQEPMRQRFERMFTNHRTVLLENANHYLQEDAGPRIVEEIRKFRAGAPATP